MGLLDVLLGRDELEARGSCRTSSPSPPSAPRAGEESEDGEDIWEKVSTCALSIDLYAERMQATLREINRPDYPAGMILWLEQANPILYLELTGRLPDEIHRLWEARGPLEQFENVLARLVQTHRQACELYRGRERLAWLREHSQ